MTEAELQRIIDDIRYRPEWTLLYSWDKDDRYIQWVFEDTEYPGLRWTCRKWRVSPHMTESEIIQTAFLAVQVAEEHESRERFTYRGIAVLSPHWDLRQLHALVASGALRENTRGDNGSVSSAAFNMDDLEAAIAVKDGKRV